MKKHLNNKSQKARRINSFLKELNQLRYGTERKVNTLTHVLDVRIGDVVRRPAFKAMDHITHA